MNLDESIKGRLWCGFNLPSGGPLGRPILESVVRDPQYGTRHLSSQVTLAIDGAMSKTTRRCLRTCPCALLCVREYVCICVGIYQSL